LGRRSSFNAKILGETRMTRHGIFALALMAATSATAQTPTPAAPPAPPPPACAGPEHRQFDFWAGYWDVYPTGKSTLVAHSLIEKLYAGCAIRENWMPLKGAGGGSLNNYVTDDKRWHQTWVDSSNARVDFVGGLTGGKMVLVGDWRGVNGPGQDAITRMIYTPNADGSVRQFGETSTDHGLTWQPSFDFTYKPSKSPPPK
jgi:hypothetical protein